MKKFLLIIVCAFFLIGCSGGTDDRSVSYMEAKEKIINEGAVLVDVRTEDEYNQKHIDGAVLFTLDEINEESVGDQFDKDDVIIVYCQSGNRSSQALKLLEDLGYTEVYDLGAISNWEE